MKVIKIYDHNRRDCVVDLECENCGLKKTNKSAYDDRNYWDNVIPNQKCKQCNKSTLDLNLKSEFTLTKYGVFEVV